MNKAKGNVSCDDVQFDVLLYGDESSAEYFGSANHVENCPHCQSQLSEMAADDGDWDSVRTMLRKERLDGAVENLNSPARSIKLDFLAPPSHPEMLGRLGRYEIAEVIGSGGMGVVLKGFDSELNRPVAIKVLAPHLAHSGAARQRFAREARAAASIVHEHVVSIYDVKSDNAAPYLVMQYIAGQSLQQRVDQSGPLATAEILRIGMQAAAGLVAAHAQGVIHRDVKPANILLENGVERAMLTDFGLARAADDATLTHSGIIAGTPHYMSPEQARGRPADVRSDLFSLGAVLYFMATGHPPFRAEQAMGILHRICHDRHRAVQQINSAIPDDLSDAIDRLLEKRPSRRFASAAEVQEALAGALVAIQKPTKSPVRRLVRGLKRRRRTLAATTGLMLVLIGGGWLIKGLTGTDAPIANHPNPPVHETPPVEALAEIIQVENGFGREMTIAEGMCALLERQTYPEQHSLRLADDAWQRELQTATAEILHLERAWSTGSDEKPFTSSIGEKR